MVKTVASIVVPSVTFLHTAIKEMVVALMGVNQVTQGVYAITVGYLHLFCICN